MTPDGIRDKFEFYRKWFRTLLMKEFLNLPTKYQDRFLVIADKFLKDCHKVCEEGKKIKEKMIKISVIEVQIPDNKEENYIVCGKSDSVHDIVRMSFPATKSHPSIGQKLTHTVFSADGEVWFSSKEELIIGRKS